MIEYVYHELKSMIHEDADNRQMLVDRIEMLIASIEAGSDHAGMKDVRTPGKIRVVAAKLPGRWIVRGIFVWSRDWDQIRAQVERHVGTLDPDVQWTAHEYDLPGYMLYRREGDATISSFAHPHINHVVLYLHEGGDPARNQDSYDHIGRVLS